MGSGYSQHRGGIRRDDERVRKADEREILMSPARRWTAAVIAG